MTRGKHMTGLALALKEQADARAIEFVAERTRSKKQVKLDEARVQKAFRASCAGIQVDILDLPRVFRVGQAAILKGADDTALESTLHAFVKTIRVD